MERSWSKAAREVGIGVGASLAAILVVFVATIFVLEMALLGVAIGTGIWAMILGPGPTWSGLWRALVPGGLVIAAVASAGVFVTTFRPMMLLISVAFAGAAIAWVWVALRA